MKERFAPNIEFPEYAYIPGQFPHPNKEGGHSYGKTEPKTMPLDPGQPYLNEVYLYGIDLFNHGYYWESHVYWEALWNAEERVGEVADFLKALIKLGAAGVKVYLKQEKTAFEHVKRAREIFSQLNPQSIGGFKVSSLIDYCEKLKDELPSLVEAQGKEFRQGPFKALLPVEFSSAN